MRKLEQMKHNKIHYSLNLNIYTILSTKFSFIVFKANFIYDILIKNKTYLPFNDFSNILNKYFIDLRI